MPRSLPAVLAELGAALRAAFGRGWVEVRARAADGQIFRAPLPPAGHEAAAPAPEVEAPTGQGRRCSADILRVLAEVGHRLTTTRLLAELSRRDIEWSERTVSGTLARMVDDGTLTNEQHTRPRGYGLPEWGDGPGPAAPAPRV